MRRLADAPLATGSPRVGKPAGRREEQARIFAANRAVGRISIEVVRRGSTRPSRVQEAGSLRVRFPTSRPAELEAVLVNTAGGIAGGDCLDLECSVGARARLVVTSATAEKVYRSSGAAARMTIKLTVDKGGALAWLPQETILFDRTAFHRSIDVALEEGSRLLLCDALLLGRSAMGEAVETADFLDRWRVRCAGRLIFADSIRLSGAIAEQLRQPACTGGGVAFASLLQVPGDERMMATVRAQAFLGEVGASTWNGITLMRFVADTGAKLRRDLLVVLRLCRGGSLPRLWNT